MNDFDDLIEYENNFDFGEFRFSFNNTLIWPFVRNILFFDEWAESFGLQTPHAPPQKQSVFEKMNYFYNLVRYNPLLSGKKADILFFSGNVHNQLRNNQYFNKYVDYYSSLFPDNSIIIEQSFRKQFFRPRYFEPVYYPDIIEYLVNFRNKVHHKTSDFSDIDPLLDTLKNDFRVCSNNSYLTSLKDFLMYFEDRLPYYDYYYNRMFDIFRPRIVFVEDAHYGGLKGYLLKTANQRGIVTAEFQHGLISLNHFAYNYADSVFCNSDYKQFLPSYFLTYGIYWTENLRSPSVSVVIGNPDLEEKVKNQERKKTRRRIGKHILIISAGPYTREMVQLTKFLVETLDQEKYTVTFRLHPGEIPFFERYEELKHYSNITIDSGTNIHALLNDADYVVSPGSTVVYEALKFCDKIYVFNIGDTECHIPKTLGCWFSKPPELIKLITEDWISHFKGNISEYWSELWQEHYTGFIKNEVRL
jgi:hypothetical protein